MTDDRDYSTLSWIKGELDQIIAQARGALADYVEGESDDRALMETCAEKLHQVHATLKIVEVYGAAMLAEEMEQLARAIGRHEVRQPEEGAESLMLALIQLPDYLEKLQTGEPDIPLVLLPLINDLRTARDGALLSEAALFHPNLRHGVLPPQVTGVPNPELQRFMRKLRAVYQQGLVRWYRGLEPELGLGKLRDVIAALKSMAGTTPAFHLFQAAHALIEGLLDQSIDSGNTVKQLLARFDRQMKLIVEEGEGALNRSSTQDLMKNLLYYVARAESDSPLILEVQAAYNLGQAIPSTEALTAVRESLSAPSLEMLKTVHGAIKEDLFKVKDSLDLYLRGSGHQLADLLALEKPLRTIADTLGMLGRGALRLRLMDEVAKIRSAGESGVVPEEDALMDMAGAILFVESSLEGQVATRWQPREDAELVTATMREVRAEMARAKDSILRFVGDPENLEPLQDVPAWFHNIAGALRVLEFPEPAEILDDLSRYLKAQVLATGHAPESASLEALAEGISSIEYFSEALVEGRGPTVRQQILATARGAQARLDRTLEHQGAYPDVTISTSHPAFGFAGAADSQVPAPEIIGESAEGGGATPAQESASAAEVVDPEILEIFLEEAREELQVIRENYPRWKSNPDDQDSLTTFRRSFHTLKGSGRLVGAVAIGEYAWSIENLLNRVIDGAIAASPEIMEVMDSALETLPALIDDEEAGREPALDIQALSKRAFALSNPENQAEAEPTDEYASLASVPQDAVIEDGVGVGRPGELGLAEGLRPQPVAEPPPLEEVDIDPEILEVFLEEAREEIDVIREHLPRWSQDRQDVDALRTIRRSFHTLKGSGRLVGAHAIGEFAWSIENLLNRVLDDRVPVTQGLFALLDDTLKTLPGLIDQLESGRLSEGQVQPLVVRAESFASGLPGVEPPSEHAASDPEQLVPQSELVVGEEPVRNVEPEALERLGQVLEHPATKEPFACQAEVEHPVTESESADTVELEEAAPDARSKTELDPQEAIDLGSESAQVLSPAQEAAEATEGIDVSGEAARPSAELEALQSVFGDEAETQETFEMPNAAELLLAQRGPEASEEAETQEIVALGWDAEQPVVEPEAEEAGTQEAVALAGEAEPLVAELGAVKADEAETQEPLDLSEEGVEPPVLVLPAAAADAEEAGIQEPVEPSGEAELLIEELEAVEADEAETQQPLELPERGVELPGLVLPEADAEEAELQETVELVGEAEPWVAELEAVGADEVETQEPLEPAEEAVEPRVAELEAVADDEVKTQGPLDLAEEVVEPPVSVPQEPVGPAGEAELLVSELEATEAETAETQHEREPSAGAAQPAPELESFELGVDAREQFEEAEPGAPPAELDGMSAPLSAESAEQLPVPESVASQLSSHGEEPVTAMEVVGDEQGVQNKEEGATPALRFGMDPVLYEIFESECREHLQTLADLVEACHQGTGACAIPEQVARAFHTLHGSAHMAEVEPMALVASALEHLVNELRFKAIPADDRVIELIDEGQFIINRLLDSIAAPDVALPETDDFLRRVADLQDQLLAEQAETHANAKGMPGSDAHDARYVEISGDPELIEIFLEEARDLLEMLDASLREWRANPAENKVLVEMQRTLHTLKGGARLAGIMPVGDLSHAYETLLTGVVSGEVQPSSEVLDLAQDTADWLSGQVEEVATAHRVKSAEALVEMLEAAREGTLRKVLAEPVQLPVQAPAATPEPAETFAPAEVHRPHQEQIRVRADLLDRLVNNAGEVSIYRSRIEQQSTSIGFHLAELEQTVDRLRTQLRQLEIETEAQILFRFERDRGSDDLHQDFDPLEMDRFSTMQQLSRSLMETVNDLVNIKDVLEDLNRANETLLLQQSRVATDLQDGLLRTRMVPFSQVVPRLHRLVRQTAKSVGKQAGLEVYGANEELDRNILERMLAPLEHILRNAVSHGVESAAARRAADKPETGRISVYVGREGTDVMLNVVDDGAGMNLEAIRRRAIERGMLKEGAEVSDDDVMQFVLTPGFSTAAEVTQVAGRGVGMDVVASGIKQLGGSLEMVSQPGRGTSFTIRLPLTLAISEALLAQVAEEIYAIPYASIEGVVRIGRDELQGFYGDNLRLYSYAGHDYQVRHLGSMLGTAALNLAEGVRWFPVLLVRSGDRRVALQVDGLLGNRQIVVKSVGPQLSSIHWITGATILGDGRVALILDLNAMIRMEAAKTISQPVAAQHMSDEGGVTVMVVDDSITVRKVTTRLLERHNMTVISAKDGMDAVTKLQERLPDIMLLDIEMPRMDGFEVARHMRNTEELKHIPVIMITSRSGEKHRQRALELGVQRYLGKPYQETELLDNIYSVLSEAKT